MSQETIQIQIATISDKLRTEEAICFIKGEILKKIN